VTSTTYLVIDHDDGRPTEVVTPQGVGVLFPRASDDSGDIFYGHPEVAGRAVFRRLPCGKEVYITAGMSVEEVQREIVNPSSPFFSPEDPEGSMLVERVTVTFW